jgi:hypothetical protein
MGIGANVKRKSTKLLKFVTFENLSNFRAGAVGSGAGRMKMFLAVPPPYNTAIVKYNQITNRFAYGR